MTWLLDHLRPALFGSVVGAAVTATWRGESLSVVCAVAGLAGLVAFALFGVLPLAWFAVTIWRATLLTPKDKP